ncbi:MAG: response regulator [Calditrichaeota bacterium]|nr:response regulator [Calditrichota bacterium]
MAQPLTQGKSVPKIAIIDPETEILEVLRQLFQNNGFQVTVFRSGADALTEFSSLQPDVVLLEIALNGEDGLNICQTIHETYPEIPIVVLSRLRTPEIRLQAIEAGAIDYLTKPYDRAFLLQKIKNLLFLLTRRPLTAPPAVSPIVTLFEQERLSIIKPEPNPNSPFGYAYPILNQVGINRPEDQQEALEALVAEGKLEHIIYDMVKQCPKCHSITIQFRAVCPECQSPAIKPIPVPGRSAQQPFQEKRYNCLHCNAVFSTSVIYGKCLNCGTTFQEADAKTHLIYSYRLPVSRPWGDPPESDAEASILEQALRESEIDYFAPDALKFLVAYEIKQARASEKRTFSLIKIDFLNLKQLQDHQDHFSVLRLLRNLLLIFRKILRPQDQVILSGKNKFYILMPEASYSMATLVKKHVLSFIDRFKFDVEFRVSVETFPDTFQTIEDILDSSNLKTKTPILQKSALV